MLRLRSVLALAVALLLAAGPAGAAAPLSRSASVSFVDAEHGFMAGSAADGGGFVSVTDDGGSTWSRTGIPDHPMMAVGAYSATNAWAVSIFDNAAWKTTSGGAWERSAGSLSLPPTPDPADVAPTGSDSAVVVGQHPSTLYGDLAAIWRTDDGGATWDAEFEGPIYPPPPEGEQPATRARFAAVDAAPGGSVLVALGNEYNKDSQGGPADYWRVLIKRSSDGGSTWTTQTADGVNGPINDVAAPSSAVAWAAGSLKQILRTTNSGATWSRIVLPVGTIPSTVNLNGIDAVDGQIAVAVGELGRVVRTNDGGATWTPWILPSQEGLYSVALLDSTHAVAVGDNEIVVMLTFGPDGSVTDWTVVEPPESDDVAAVIDAVTPNPAVFGQSVTFTGHGTDGEGHTITAYEWKDGETVISTSASFTRSDLAPGSHSISFRVRCSNGTWSAPSTRTLTITPAPSDTVVATIDSVSPNPSVEGQSVTLTGHGTDSQGHDIVAYEWKEGATVLSTAASFAKSDFSVGVHAVSFRARCSDDVWSAPVEALVTVTPTGSTTVERVAGSDRFGTAVKLSQEAFDPGSVSDIVVASGMGFADALSASGLAGAFESPILLVPSAGSVPTAVTNEIKRIAAAGARVWVVGGTAVVPDSVARQLKVGTVASVERLAGSTRYHTSAAVAAKVKQVEGPSFAGTAFVASGANFPDALASSPVAWARSFPVLLTEPSKLTAATSSAVTANGITRCVITGGPVAVSDATKNAIDGLSGVSVERWAAADRYATATTIAANAKTRGWASYGYVGVASGENFPDALAGGPVAGSFGGVMVLTQSKQLPAATTSFLKARSDEIAVAKAYGGAVAISDGVLAAVNSALK